MARLESILIRFVITLHGKNPILSFDNMQSVTFHKLVFSRSKREVIASMTADLEGISQ